MTLWRRLTFLYVLFSETVVAFWPWGGGWFMLRAEVKPPVSVSNCPSKSLWDAHYLSQIFKGTLAWAFLGEKGFCQTNLYGRLLVPEIIPILVLNPPRYLNLRSLAYSVNMHCFVSQSVNIAEFCFAYMVNKHCYNLYTCKIVFFNGLLVWG